MGPSRPCRNAGYGNGNKAPSETQEEPICPVLLCCASTELAAFVRELTPIPSAPSTQAKPVATKDLLNMRETTKRRLAMKTEKADWDGFQVKPPPLRQKRGFTTGRRLAEPTKPAVRPGPSKEQLTKWISRRTHSAAKKSG